MAATLSALGMLTADVQLDYVQTVMLPGNVPLEELQAHSDQLVDQGLKDLAPQTGEHPASRHDSGTRHAVSGSVL